MVGFVIENFLPYTKCEGLYFGKETFTFGLQFLRFNFAFTVLVVLWGDFQRSLIIR